MFLLIRLGMWDPGQKTQRWRVIHTTLCRGDFRCQCERDCGKEMCVLLSPGKAATLSRPAEVRLSLPRTVCVSSMEFFCLGDASLLHCFLIQPLALTCMGCRHWCCGADPAVPCLLSRSQGLLWPRGPLSCCSCLWLTLSSVSGFEHVGTL